MTPETLAEQARGLARDASGPDDAVAAIRAAAGDDRRVVEAARDVAAGWVRTAVDDFEATAALTFLNRTLAKLPRHDPMDWRVRWTKHRKP